MKRENLYIISAALLASTALSTSANAGVVTVAARAGNDTSSTATAKSISAQVFGTTPSATAVLGTGATGGTQPVGLTYRFPGSLRMGETNFSATIGVTGAQFNTANVSAGNQIRAVTFSVSAGVGSINDMAADVNSIQCSGLVATTTTLLISNCTASGAIAAGGSIGGFHISTIAFDNATGLATVGGTISIAGTVNLGASAGVGAVFDTTAAQVVVRSINSLNATVTAGTPAQINVGATPAFARMASNGLTTTLASINITLAGAVGADLTTALAIGSTVGGTGNNVVLTSAIVSDDAVRDVTLENGTRFISVTPTQFGSGNVTFAIPSSTGLNVPYTVVVNFNGTAAIDALAAGSVAVNFSANGATNIATANSTAPAGATGTAAGLTRSGLTVNVNSIQPSVAQGARTYSSLIRLVNSSSAAGVATIIVRNNETGVTLGTYTSPSIPASGSLQLTSAALEAGAGITPSAAVLYQATVTGAFNGYVQHVNWNQDAGFFSDLSGKRVD
jgi:hypothetical protein